MSDSDDFIADSSSALAATADLADDSSAAEPSTTSRRTRRMPIWTLRRRSMTLRWKARWPSLRLT